MGKVRATVLIPTWKRFNCAKKCLHNILVETYSQKYGNIVMLNNGGDAETRALCYEYHEKNDYFGYLETSKNIGIAPILNLGVKFFHDMNDYLVFMPDDNFIHTKNWLEIMLDLAESVEDIGILQTESYNDKIKEMTYREHNDLIVSVRPMDNLGQINLISPKAMRAVGYWCEDYGLYGFEDTDLGRRITYAGFSTHSISKGYVNCNHGRVDENGNFIKPLANGTIPDGGIEKLMENRLADNSTLPIGHNKLTRNTFLYQNGKRIYQNYNNKHEQYITHSLFFRAKE